MSCRQSTALRILIEIRLVLAFTNAVYSTYFLRLERPFVSKVPSLLSCCPKYLLNSKGGTSGNFFCVPLTSK
jgi:hypothetical protein